MKYYIGVIHHDNNVSYGIHFPDVPGCYSAGNSITDTMKNGREALELFFDDIEQLPEARNIDEIIESGEIDDDIADNAILVYIPWIENDGITVKANITMDKGLLRDIDVYAKQHRQTRSAFLASAARKEIQGA